MEDPDKRHVRVMKEKRGASAGASVMVAVVVVLSLLGVLALGGVMLFGFGSGGLGSIGLQKVPPERVRDDAKDAGRLEPAGGDDQPRRPVEETELAESPLGSPAGGEASGAGVNETLRVEDGAREMPEGTWPRDAMAGLASVKPPTPWMSLPEDETLTRIGVGSCLSQTTPQPIWDDVLALEKRPDLFLMVGDNVYGDIKSADYRELIGAYRKQGRHPDFAKARAAFPFLATWDDHDYGGNDAGAEFAYKHASSKLFRDFWQVDDGGASREGIYYAKMIGPPGKRVHFIMLDTRTFRSKLMRATRALPYWGRYEPSDDETLTMLGPRQWYWFLEQVARPAELRIIVSSVQVLALGHGFERWGNLPHEMERLLSAMLGGARVPSILVSGDRHMGAIYQVPFARGRVLPEVTASSLNRSYGPSRDRRGFEVVSDFYHRENFALIDVDWASEAVEISLRGLHGKIFHVAKYPFARLGGGGNPRPADAR